MRASLYIAIALHAFTACVPRRSKGRSFDGDRDRDGGDRGVPHIGPRNATTNRKTFFFGAASVSKICSDLFCKCALFACLFGSVLEHML